MIKLIFKLLLCNNLIYILLFGACSSSSVEEAPCVERRAAFDIGSATSKMKVAEVNHCLSRIEKTILEKEEYLGFKEDLIKNNGVFSDSIIQEAINVISKLKIEANEQGKAFVFSAVATESFRQAKNSAQAISIIREKTGIQIKIITQEEEGHLGFIGASAKSSVPLDKLVVWDIGGSSMQISIQGTNKNEKVIFVYMGKMASIPFKQLVIEKIQKKSNQITSPNPISIKQSKTAIKFAKIEADKIPPIFIQRIKQNETTNNATVVGIGMVHSASILNQINLTLDKKNTFYTLDDLRQVIAKRINFSDEQIGGKYFSTEISNLLLIQGFMEALGIKKVDCLKINLSDGLLIYPKFWSNRI